VNDNRKDQRQPTTGKLPGGFMMILIAVAVVILLNMLMNTLSNQSIQEIRYSEFISMLKEGRVATVEIQTDRLMITTVSESAPAITPEPTAAAKSFDDLLSQTESRLQEQGAKPASLYYTGRMEDPDLRQLLDRYGVEYYATIQSSNWLQYIFFQLLLPIIFIYGLWLRLRRSMSGLMGGGGGRGGFMSIGQSNAKK
jgi:cell division protease FtsH